MANERRVLWPLLFCSLFLIFFSKWKVEKSFDWRYPPLTDLVVTENYMSDLGSLFLGAHRLAADLAYIQFLQYYGTHPEEEVSHAEGESESDHHHHGHSDLNGGGNYPRVLELGTRLMRLDPYFNAPLVEISGALAFNLNKVDEALSLLSDAIQRDPSFYRYRIYAAAILYKNKKNDKVLIDLLTQAIQFPDCPVLLENILANLLRQSGQFQEMANVLSHIIETAPYEYEREGARMKLDQLVLEHPELKKI